MKDKNKQELVQYYIINKDLKMSPGKIGVQIARVATKIAEAAQNTQSYEEAMLFQKWLRGDQTVIILKANQNKIKELVREGFYFTEDLGRTEVPPDSLTCVGLGVMARTEARPHIKRLQLL